MAGVGVPQDIHAAYEAFQFACNQSRGSESAEIDRGHIISEQPTATATATGTSGGGSSNRNSDSAAAVRARASLEAGNILFSGFGSG